MLDLFQLPAGVFWSWLKIFSFTPVLFYTTKPSSWAETERQTQVSRFYICIDSGCPRALMTQIPQYSPVSSLPFPYFHSKTLIRHLTLLPHTKLTLIFFHYENNYFLLNNGAQIPEFSVCFIVSSDTCSDISKSDLSLNFFIIRKWVQMLIK